ncbi:Regulator of nucleoside diphosphate kinase [Maioricimonas rarisocia]|uniref:Regulator of nucleoside diphosphate kinase n=1 Tax=Maioricimonas rarisocia TaxID=2528026 RepID=A0A517Z0F5_9PLAN|nr:nucleoside diphosphate kinase regulator [Maioricimonas rarisocia]QDU35971.1 Regulator of nucleoside diphosphate kinase [Maioricimonas rarisocia]
MVAVRRCLISREDHDQLENLLLGEFAAAFSDKTYVQSLRLKLSVAEVVEAGAIPSDVVTMNSTIRIRDTRTNEDETYTLVYPRDADIASGHLSVLAPIGTAILGQRVGDRVRWQVPGGTTRLCIEAILFQPERDGVVS